MAFFAIRLPKKVQDAFALSEWAAAYPSLRFEKPFDLHITLRFFPNGDDKNLKKILKAMESFPCEIPPFELHTKGVRTFDHGGKGGVLWIGLREIPLPLRTLQDDLEAFAQTLGYAPETRAFTPHVTLLRYRGDQRAEVKELIERMESCSRFEQSFSARGFRLMKRSAECPDQNYKDVFLRCFTGVEESL